MALHTVWPATSYRQCQLTMGCFYKDNSHIIKNDCNNFFLWNTQSDWETQCLRCQLLTQQHCVTSQKSAPISNTAVRDLNLTDILVIQKSLFIGVMEMPCWPHTELKACSQTVCVVMLLPELKYGK